MSNTEKLYPKVFAKEDFETWITDYITQGFYLFFINPNSKMPFKTEAFELPEETERRLREEHEEKNDPSLEKEARAQARQNDQKYGHGFKDATNILGDPNNPEPGTLYWLYLKACKAETFVHPKTKQSYPIWPQIACATEKSGLLVVDLDMDVDFQGVVWDAPSRQGLQKLEEEYGELPACRMVKTPRNGRHLYFQGSAPMSAGQIYLKGQRLAGIDIRSKGGYVILPPSICAVKGKGKKGKKVWMYNGQYEWMDDNFEYGIPVAPDWLIEIARTKGEKPSKPRSSKGAKGDPRASSGDASRAPRALTPADPGCLTYDVEAIIAKVHTGEIIEEGTRNDTLYRIACTLRDNGFGFEEEEIAEVLEAINAAFCTPQYTEVAMAEFASRACQYERGYRPWL
jgi:Bifunctional DNA primase/polymerase, N-terminal